MSAPTRRQSISKYFEAKAVVPHSCHQYIIQSTFESQSQPQYRLMRNRSIPVCPGAHGRYAKKLPQKFILTIRLDGFELAFSDAVQHKAALEQMGLGFLDISYGFQMEQEPEVPVEYPSE